MSNNRYILIKIARCAMALSEELFEIETINIKKGKGNMDRIRLISFNREETGLIEVVLFKKEMEVTILAEKEMGFEFAKKLKEECAGIPEIFSTKISAL